MKFSKVLKAIRAELAKPLPEPRVVWQPVKKRKRKMAKKAKKGNVDEELDEDLDEGEDEEAEDEDEEAEEKPAKKSKKGKDKKGAKSKDKGKKKAAKSDEDSFDGVTIEDLAEEAGINAQSARVKLREAELEKPEGGRWRWADGSKGLKSARKALGL